MRSQTLSKVNELLDALEQTTGEPGDLNGTLQHIAQTALKVFAADACVIFVINPITNRYIESQTLVGNQIKGKVFFEKPRPEGLTQQVLKSGVLLVEDLEVKPEYHSTFTRSESIRSFAALALRVGHNQKPLGVLYLNFRQQQQFSPNVQKLLHIFSEQSSFILQEAWLLQRYQEVARIGQEINHELATIELLFQRLQEYVASILDISHTLLLAIYQQQSNTLDLFLETEGQAIIIENDPMEGACQHVIETQQALFIRQYSKESEHLPFQLVEIAETEPKESVIFVPLVFRGISLGVLSIQHPQPNAYTQEDLFILQLLANHIAVAISNMRLYNHLSRLNQTGQLLTQQLDSERVLQLIVDKIKNSTLADVVVLYPYESEYQRFVLPPRMAGALLDSTFPQTTILRSDDIAVLALNYREPIFAKESTEIYTHLHYDVHIEKGNFIDREQIRSAAVVPLRVGETSVGVLFVNFRQPQRFESSQKLLIEGLGHYAAIAIKNAQEYGTLSHRHMHELEILQSVDHELNRNLDLQSVLDTILRKAHEHISAEAASILLYDPLTQALKASAAIGRNTEAYRDQIIPLEIKGITRWVVEHKESVRVDNVQYNLPWRNLYLPVAVDTLSELDVPLLDGEEVVGVLNFESIRERAFSQEDQDFLQTLAGQVVLAIKKAQAYEREKRLANEGRALNEVSKQIISQLDFNHICDLILDKALELTQSTTGGLMIYDVERNDLWIAAERGIEKDRKIQRQGLDQGVVGYAAKTKQVLNVDLSQTKWSEINLDLIPGTLSELAVPMLAGNDLLGVLNVESSLPNNFSNSDERLLTGLADLTVIALQNAQAYQREKHLVEEAQALYAISKQITSQLDFNHICDLILDKALELTNSHVGSLMLYDPDQNNLWMAVEHGVTGDKKGQRQSLDQGIVGYVAKNKQLLNMDASQESWKDIYVEFIPGTLSELAVPMLAGNDLLGVLNVESPLPNNFSDSDERLLTGLADLTVIALQNAQAYQREKHLVEEAQALYAVSKQITSQLDPSFVLNLILDKALELTNSNMGNVMLYDPDQNNLWMAAQRGVAEDKKGTRLGLHQGIVGYVARTKELKNVDTTQEPWKDIYVEFAPETHFELAVPLLAGNDLRGVLNIESPLPNNFSDSDERLLTGLADLAVIALQNAQAYQREKHLVEEAQALYAISKQITSQLDFTHVFDLILDKALELTNSIFGALLVYDPLQNDLKIESVRGVAEDKKGTRLGLHQGIVGYVARTKELKNVDTTQEPWKDIYVEFAPETHFELAVPLLAGNDLRGVLNIESRFPKNFTERDVYLLSGLADLAVVALQMAERYKKAEREAQRFVLLYKVGRELGKLTEWMQLKQAYDIILQIAEEYGQCQVAIYGYDDDTQELMLVHASGHEDFLPFPQLKLDEGLNKQIIQERNTIVISDTQDPPPGVSVKLSDPKIRSLVITPIILEDRYYGNLALYHPDVGHFQSLDETFTEGLAQQLADTMFRLEAAKARQELEQMSSIGQSAIGIAHRLGNDLGLVDFYSSDIRSELETLGVTNLLISERLQDIVRSVQAALSFSKDLKQELANLGNQEETAGEPTLISPRALLEEASAISSLPVNIQLSLKIDDDIATVRVIHRLVTDILHHLVTNAIQAMPEGGEIILRAHNIGRFVALEVIDNGKGIPPEKLPRIFDLFYSSKRSSGFGLWSARRNALRNHGNLKVESLLGQGTTFTLLLPRADGVKS